MMKVDGIDILYYIFNYVDDYVEVLFDFVIMVCDYVKECCLYFFMKVQIFYYNFLDLVKVIGILEEVVMEFECVRNMIRLYMYKFVQMYIDLDIVVFK